MLANPSRAGFSLFKKEVEGYFPLAQMQIASVYFFEDARDGLNPALLTIVLARRR
jgi:hypothetical protein